VLQSNVSPTARLYIACQDGQLLLSNPKRPMSALARARLFAQSQAHEMHFKLQHDLVVQGKVTFRKLKPLPPVEGLIHRVENRECHRPDTDSRLLTQRNGGWINSWP
jgi:hypothetical protein